MKRALSLRRKLLYGFTLSVVAILLILPETGWLARLQLLPFTTPSGATDLLYTYDYSLLDQYEARTDRVVAANRDDFQLRFAHATRTIPKDGTGSESLRRVFELNESFPNNPSVISAILKTMLRTKVKMHRQDEQLLDAIQTSKASYSMDDPTDPAQVAKFISFAEAGETREPQNAYFPLMASFGYFVMRNDEKAVAAWVRAGEKPEWDDHSRDEAKANWALERAVNYGNEVGALARMGAICSINYMQFGAVRSCSRMATVMAWKAWQKKDRDREFSIRRATRRIGQNMQTNCWTYSGNSAGTRVLNTCAQYSLSPKRKLAEPLDDQPPPGDQGGAESVTLTRRMALSPEQQQQQYINYLRANGHSKEATAYWIAVRDGDMLQEQYDRVGIYLGGISYRKMERLFVAWCTNCISISGAMFSLVLGGIFQLVHRFSPHLQKSEPLQKSAKWGVTLGLALPAILIMASVISPNAITLKLKLHSDDVFKIGIGIGFMVLTISPFLFRLSWREVGHGLLVILATLASLVVLHKAGTVGSILMCGVANVLGFSLSFSTGEPRADTWRDLVPYLPYLMVFPIPGILLLLFGTISRILRIPLAAGITRGMSAVGAPLACVLALIWAVTLLQTLRLENAAIVKMERMIAVGERKQLETIFRYQQNLRR